MELGIEKGVFTVNQLTRVKTLLNYVFVFYDYSINY